MNRIIYRLVGIALIIAALAGLMVSVVGLVSVWRLKTLVTEQLLGSIAQVSEVLITTEDGLVAAEGSLSATMDSLAALESTIAATARTIDASAPLVDTLASLSSEDLPETVASAQESLVSAQESARIIDSVLTALDALPFVDYNPPVPLHVALQRVSTSMDDIPASLLTMEQSLNEASGNIEIIQADISLIANDVSAIRTSLEDSRAVVIQYQVMVDDLQAWAGRTEATLPDQVNLAAIVLTFFLAWWAVAQFGFLLQGWELVLKTRGEQGR